jgi:hypothetical protein
MKTMLIISFDIQGILPFEFIPQDQTVNKTYHMEILKWELWPNDWQCFSSQGALCQVVLGPKIDY